ncbi:MAG: PAS domain S-box protein [Caldisericota bacterium]|nr:PAS domain S-box protein [Caldisericota bacterium]
MIAQIFASSNYYFNPYAIPVMVTAVILFIFGVVSLFLGVRSKTNSSFFLVALTLFIWVSGTSILYVTQNPELALFFYKRYTFLGLVLIPPSAYLLILSLFHKLRKKKWLVLVNYIIMLLFYFIANTTDLMFIGVRKHFWGYSIQYDRAGLYLLVVFAFLLLLTLYYYVRVNRAVLISKTQRKLFLFSYLVGCVTLVDILPAFGFEVYPFGYITILIFAIIQWYSIGKYRESLPYLALNSVSDGVIAVNSNGKIIHINSVAEKLMNVQSDSILHKDVSEYFCSSSCKLVDQEQFQMLLKQVKTDPSQVINTQIEYIEPAKRINLTTLPVANRLGEVTEVMFMLNDITEYEQLKDDVEQYQEFLENMVKKRTKQLKDVNKQLKQDISKRKQLEKELLIQKKYFQELFENSSMAVAQLDTDNKIIAINEGFTTLFQYSSEEVVGKRLIELVVPESLGSESEFFFSSGMKGKKPKKESVRKRKDGSLVSVYVHAVPISVDNKVVGMYAVYVDITNIKKVEEKLKEEGALISSMLEAVPHAVIGLRDHHIVFANKNVKSVFGWEREELIGKTTRLFYRSDKEFEQIGNDFYSTLENHKYCGEEFPCKRKDGKDILCRVSASRIGDTLKDKQIVVMYEDITERKRTITELQESNEKLSSLFYNYPAALVNMDNDSHILDANPAFEKLFGYSIDEVRGRNINDGMIHPEEKKDEGKNLDEKALSEGYLNYETVRKRKNGTLFPVLVSGLPIVVNGEIKGVMGAYVDITERKKSERIKDVISKISEAVYSTNTLDELYDIIHQNVSVLMHANNFYIAMYDEFSKMLSFKYWVDETDPKPKPRELRKGITEYVFNTGKSLIADPEVIKVMQNEGKTEIHDTLPVSWLGVPLKVQNKTVGVLAVQSYTEGVKYTEDDKKVLSFVSDQIALAIERKKNEELMLLQKSRLETLFEGAPIAIAMLDKEERVIDANEGFQKLFRYSINEIRGQFIDDFIVPNELKEKTKRVEFEVEQGKVVALESIRQRKGGSLVNVSIFAYPIMLGPVMHGIYAIYIDITEHKKRERQLSYIATHDALTGLPNRVYFENRFALEVELSRRNNQKFALLYIDLNEFKKVNDELGHAVGDVLLKQVADRFTELLRKSDVVARMGGDEFVLLLPEITKEKEIHKIVKKFFKTFKEPFIVEDHKINVSLSIGGVIFPDDGTDSVTLLKKVDNAMYNVKEHGVSTYQYYQSDIVLKAE